jgi:hypothetical protein
MITFGKKRILAAKVKEASKWDEFIAKTKDQKNVEICDQKPPLVLDEKGPRILSRKRSAEDEIPIEMDTPSESLNSGPDQDLVSEVSAFDCFDQISPVKVKTKGRVKRMERQKSSPLKPTNPPRPPTVKESSSGYKGIQKREDNLKQMIVLPVRRQSAVTFSRSGSGSLISSNPTASVPSIKELASPLDELFDSLDQDDEIKTTIDEGLESSSDDEKVSESRLILEAQNPRLSSS